MTFIKQVIAFINNRPSILFWFFLALIWYFFDYSTLLNSRPWGLHFIRQTDGLAFVYGYAEGGMDFFHPAMLNQSSFGGRSVCEFPILYYVSALLYKAGLSPLITLRIIHFSIVIFGLWSLNKLLNLITNNPVVSALIPLIVFGSTVFSFYSLNYLPDAAALGFCLAGISRLLTYYFLKDLNKSGLLYWGYFYCVFAAMFKVTYLIYPAVFASVFFACYLRNYFEGKLFWKSTLFFIGLCLIVFFWWFGYVLYYNDVNGSHYFMTTISPAWSFESSQNANVLNYILVYWRNAYFQYTVWILSAVSILYLFFKRNADSFFVRLLLTGMTLGVFVYLILFFEKFRDHDYYFLTIIPFVITTLVVTSIVVINSQTWKKWSKPLTLVLLSIVIMSVNYTSGKLKHRMDAKSDFFTDTLKELNELDLVEFGVAKGSKIGVFGDRTMNGSLVVLKSKGLTLAESENYIQKEQHIVMKEMDYFCVVDSNLFSNFVKKEAIQIEEVGTRKGARLYRNLSRSETFFGED